MFDLTHIFAGLFVAALTRHLACRLLVRRTYPLLRDNSRRMKRAAARVAELVDEGDIEARCRIHDEEGVSLRSPALLIGGLIAIWVAGLGGAWTALELVGGPFAQHVWWLGPLWLLGNFMWAVASSRDPKLSSSQAGIAVVLVFVLMEVPLLAIYSLAPVGVVIFAALCRLTASIGWRLAPYRADDLPTIALILL